MSTLAIAGNALGGEAIAKRTRVVIVMGPGNAQYAMVQAGVWLHAGDAERTAMSEPLTPRDILDRDTQLASLRNTVNDLRQKLATVTQEKLAMYEEAEHVAGEALARMQCLEQQLAASQARCMQLKEALKDCDMMARRMLHRLEPVDPEWSHIARFCKEAGVESTGILRTQQALTPTERPPA